LPLYDFKCTEGHVFERAVKLADFEVVQECVCGAVTTRVISAPRFSVDNVGYDCPVTGEWIGSKRQHEENLKKHGCRVYEAGETDELKQTKAKEEAAFDKGIEDTVEREFEQMSSEKKENLANELLGGADLAIERK
jgi:putative FmdB family regulatory protein